MPDQESVEFVIDDRPAVAAADRANTALRRTESTAIEVGRSIGNVFESLAKNSLKVAEAAGGIALTIGAFKGLGLALRGGTSEITAHTASMDGLVNSYRAARIAISPTMFTGFTIAAGIAVEATIRLVHARKALYDQEGLEAARAKTTFTDSATIGILQRTGVAGARGVFGNLTAQQLHEIAESFQEIEDPAARSAKAVELFGANAEKALPLLRDNLKDTVDRAYELALAVDEKTRVSLRHMSDDLSSPIDRLRDLKNSILEASEAAKVGIVVKFAQAYEFMRPEAPGQPMTAPNVYQQLGLPTPPAAPEIPSYLDIMSDMKDQVPKFLTGRQFTAAVPAGALGIPGSGAAGRTLDFQLETVRQQLSATTEQYTAMLSSGVTPPAQFDRAIESLQERQKSLERSQAFVRSVDALIVQTAKSIPYLVGGQLGVTSPFEEQLSAQSGRLFTGATTLQNNGYFGGATSSYASDQLKRFASSQIPNLLVKGVALEGQTSLLDTWAAGQKEILESQTKADSEHVAALQRQLSLEEKLVQIVSGDDSRAAVENIYQLRLAYAKEEFEVSKTSMGGILANYKQLEQMDQARISRAEQLAKIDQQDAQNLLAQHESVAKAAEGPIRTLFTNPSQFGRSLVDTVHAAVLKPVVEGVSNLVANVVTPIVYGPTGNGGIAGGFRGLFGGGNQDAVKVSTDMNTSVTLQNSMALAGLTAALVAMIGGSSLMGAPMAGIGDFSRGGASSSIVQMLGAPGGGSTNILRMVGGGGGFAGVPGGGLISSVGSLAPMLSVMDASGGGTVGGAGASVVSGGGPATGFSMYYPDTSSGTASYLGSGGFGGTPDLSLGGGSLTSFATGGGGFFGGGGGPGLTTAAGIGRGFNPSAIIGAPGKSGIAGLLSIAQPGGATSGTPGGRFAGTLAGLKGTVYNQNAADSASLTGASTFGSTATGILSSSMASSAGFALAKRGLLGTDEGSGKGLVEGTAGGALIGFEYGGLVGAAIGATVGFGIGLGEMVAGVEPQWKEAQNLVKQKYGVSIDKNTANQIVAIAKQKYGNNVAVAVQSPDVRQMLQLYAASTGQKMPLSASQPHAGVLTEQGGQLYQQATYQYGSPFAYQSNLPILGGSNGVGTYPNPGTSAPTLMQVLIDGKGSGDYMAGSVFTPTFVQNQWSTAQSASQGRLSNSAMIQAPGLITG